MHICVRLASTKLVLFGELIWTLYFVMDVQTECLEITEQFDHQSVIKILMHTHTHTHTAYSVCVSFVCVRFTFQSCSVAVCASEG